MNEKTVLIALTGLALLIVPYFKSTNNNPLNIKYSSANNWVGQIGMDAKGFVKFKAPVYALRAGFKILKTYASKGVVTIEQIIERYAPPVENDTQSYINFVSNKLGMMRTQIVPESKWPQLIQAMTHMETGKPQPITLILQAREMS